MSLVLFTSMVGLLIAPNQVSFLDSIMRDDGKGLAPAGLVKKMGPFGLAVPKRAFRRAIPQFENGRGNIRKISRASPREDHAIRE